MRGVACAVRAVRAWAMCAYLDLPHSALVDLGHVGVALPLNGEVCVLAPQARLNRYLRMGNDCALVDGDCLAVLSDVGLELGEERP